VSEPEPAPELARRQRWLQAAITRPDGPRGGDAEDVLTASATQTAAERLGIYQRSYQARLLECLRAVFPALRHALGEPLFDRFAADYLARHPPGGYTLGRLADAFPGYLAATRPDADWPAEARAPWADLLVELATLELACQEVYDGPGLEGGPAPAADEILALPRAALLAARFVPAPCLRLFCFDFPVHDYVAAVHYGEAPALPAPRVTPLAVSRRDYRVRFHPLFPDQHALLTALDGRPSLGEALAMLDDAQPIDPAVLRCWLRLWLDDCFFAAVERTWIR
jgi:Putative DNA-binding domain